MDSIGVQLAILLTLAPLVAYAIRLVREKAAIAARSSQSSQPGAMLRPLDSGDWLTPPEAAVPVRLYARASVASRAPPRDTSLQRWLNPRV